MSQVTKQCVSVTEMSRMVGLSRARFYQLMNQGVFPTPARRGETNRPFYDREGQEQCLLVRRTN
ncbi:MAG: helix-turn-helix transcriptional regulator, partial [Planctomycetota bacterium]